MENVDKQPAAAPTSPGVSSAELNNCLEELLKFVLESSINGSLDVGLTREFCSALLKDGTGADDPCGPCLPSSADSGVTTYPLYKYVASALLQSIASGSLYQSFDEASPKFEEHSVKQTKEEWEKLIMVRGFELVNKLNSVNFELHVQEPYFMQLKDGLKTVEGRCAVGNYNQISSGAIILFNKCLLLDVVDVQHYASFSEMLEIEGLDRVLPGVTSIQKGVAIYRGFYTEEKEKMNGVLAIRVCKSASQPYIVLADIIAGLNYSGIQNLIGLQQIRGTVTKSLPPARSTLL